MSFQKIGLFIKHNQTQIEAAIKLIQFLEKNGHSVILESDSAALIPSTPTLPFNTATRDTIGQKVDLVIVMGGDGSLLNAARAIVANQIPILGINQGKLGFLTDILPHEIETELLKVLKGEYLIESRFLLTARVMRNQNLVAQNTALNDVILNTGHLTRMLNFDVFIDERFVLHQEADGIIAATPTGSTAYALSAGGPILYPTLKAISLTPLCAHTLSSRPIVIDSDSHIKLVINLTNTLNPNLSFDGQTHIDLVPGDEILIEKHAIELKLIHPKPHEYYAVLREKLGWGTRGTEKRNS